MNISYGSIITEIHFYRFLREISMKTWRSLPSSDQKKRINMSITGKRQDYGIIYVVGLLHHWQLFGCLLLALEKDLHVIRFGLSFYQSIYPHMPTTVSYFISSWDNGTLQSLVMGNGGIGGVTGKKCIGLVLSLALLNGMSFPALFYLLSHFQL